MKIGLFGGSFDPPHIGHRAVARNAMNQLGLDLLYWIPSGIPPHKESATANVDQRARMIRSCLEEREKLLTYEMENSKVSYSIATVAHIQSLHPDARLFFILGGDAFAQLPTWHQWDDLKNRVTFAVYARGPVPDGSVEGLKTVFIEGDAIEASSARIREKLYRCLPVKSLLPHPVLEVIDAEVLYACEIPEGMKRHINAVEAAAGALADRWNLPRNMLVKAARYHDAYRPMPFNDARTVLSDHGEKIDSFEEAAPILLHGRIAALRLMTMIPSADEHDWIDTANAVRFHTTGRADMSPIEETLFVADRIEKDWDRIDDVPHDRTAAVKQALMLKKNSILERNMTPHPRMTAACKSYGIPC